MARNGEDDWFVSMELPPGAEIEARYLIREDSNTKIGSAKNIIRGIAMNDSPLNTPGSAGCPRDGVVHYFSDQKAPVLEVQGAKGDGESFAFEKIGPGRYEGEFLFRASLTGLPPRGDWRFRVRLDDGRMDQPAYGPFYRTALTDLWLQDGAIYYRQPAARVSSSEVVKIEDFKAGSSVKDRALYVYLPRGYAENTDRRYPVLYMHDGQNCFEAFASDSFAGTWKADLTADMLIDQGRMRETIIVGVANGGADRLQEYLPPYTTFYPEARRASAQGPKRDIGIMGAFMLEATLNYAEPETSDNKGEGYVGRSDEMAAYLMGPVEDYITANYRVLEGRENRATCGSSLGGLFSTYIAWEHPEFAKSHAAVSPSYWITENESGQLETIERLRTGERRDIRLWLDSGTQSMPGKGMDGMWDTFQARDALLQNGYALGRDFWHFLDIGATHSEGSWASRLNRTFLFLYPISQEVDGASDGAKEPVG